LVFNEYDKNNSQALVQPPTRREWGTGFPESLTLRRFSATSVKTIKLCQSNRLEGHGPIIRVVMVYNRLIVITNFDQALPDTVGLPPRPERGPAQE